MSTRICTLLNKADRDLFVYGLGMGDLTQLHSARVDPNNSEPFMVVVGYGYQEDQSDIWMSRGWYFKYITSGTLGIYISRVPQGAYTSYWAHFHKVHCEGAICIVHEKYLFPQNWEFDPSNPPAYNYKPLFMVSK